MALPSHSALQPRDEIDTERVLPIVVGAHLQAELWDRGPAYRLRELAASALGQGHRLEPVVCTDLWYMNSPALRGRPTISVGSPGLNALSAYLADKLPSAFVVDGVLMVQYDPQAQDPAACCWGVDAESTAAAVDAFCDRYLGDFLDAAARCGS